MQSIRRAAFRSAVSASRAVSSPARSAPFAAQISRQAIVPVARQSTITSARFFSQTSRVAEEERHVEEQYAQDLGPRQELRENETEFGVFVRNLVYDASDEHLAALFEKFGKVHHAKVARDAGKMSRGYGFVYFTNEQDRQEAIRNTDGSFFHGRRLAVAERAQRDSMRSARRSPHASPSPTNCLYFGNIPFEATDAELNEFFGSLSGVTDVRVAVDRTTGWPRGFCHVDFKDEEAATAALESLQGKTLRDRVLKIDYATKAEPYRRREGEER